MKGLDVPVVGLETERRLNFSRIRSGTVDHRVKKDEAKNNLKKNKKMHFILFFENKKNIRDQFGNPENWTVVCRTWFLATLISTSSYQI